MLDQYRDQIRLKQYSPRTEKTYIHWVREFILFHNKRHPREMGVVEINQFINHLVVERQTSASTQNQAINALLYAQKQRNWQYVFPASVLSNDPQTGIVRRHHIHETALQKSIRAATQLAKIDKLVTPHTFRHSFAIHLL